MKFNLKPRPHHLPLIVVTVAAVALSIGLVLTLLQKDSPAASGNLYTTPKSASVTKGNDVTYTVRIFPGTSIDTVTATLSYDPAKLTYKSVSYKDSPFSVQIPAIKKSGSVTVQAAQFNGNVTNDSFIASVVFTALDNGTPKVTLSGNAAHAGIATNPAINGSANENPITDTPKCQGSSCTTVSGDDKNSASSNPVMDISQRVLKAAGLSAITARRAAPWLIGIILCALIGIGVAAFLIIRHRRHTLQSNNHKNIQDNTGKTDGTA